MSNYLTKADLKKPIGINTLKVAKHLDLVASKFDVDKLDINKLKNVSSNLSNLKTKVEELDVNKLVS